MVQFKQADITQSYIQWPFRDDQENNLHYNQIEYNCSINPAVYVSTDVCCVLCLNSLQIKTVQYCYYGSRLLSTLLFSFYLLSLSFFPVSPELCSCLCKTWHDADPCLCCKCTHGPLWFSIVTFSVVQCTQNIMGSWEEWTFFVLGHYTISQLLALCIAQLVVMFENEMDWTEK